ncbi:MAG: DUF883 family protein [Candidatus Nucleicultricaceae bacterium]
MSINKEFIDDFKMMLKKYRSRMDRFFKEIEESSEDNSEIKDKVDTLQKLLDDADQLYDTLKDASEETWDDLYDKAVDILKSLKDSFHQLLKETNLNDVTKLKEDVLELGQERLHKLEKYIEKKPIAAALTALCLGFLVGFCSRGGGK